MECDKLFERILLPLPSEYFPEVAVKRSIQLASRFNSDLILEYIFEEQVIDKVNDVSSGAVSYRSLRKMTKEMKKVELGDESEVIFDRVRKLVDPERIKIQKLAHSGIHTDEILCAIREQNIDLMITEFHKESLLKYRILYNCPVPIWIEHSGKDLNKIYGILTNLSPNKLVPKMAFNLSKKFNLPLKFFYVLDSSDEFDEHDEEEAQKKLLTKLKKLRVKHKVRFEFDVIIQEISSFLNHSFKKRKSGLVVLGRFKKPAKLPFMHLDKKIEVSKKIGANVLILR